ncbi:MAG: 3'(2'),5'-bisphosphate nucleotidase CysQ [Saprospiraceae bacterium]|nr:3'(2'),5'-bisphosphate nucleotidase CysQ [Saprospiraceae bacterium]
MHILDNKYNLLDLTNAVIEIVRKAGLVIMEVYQQDFQIISKEDSSPLTQADLASNEVIVSHLMQLTPEIPIISEESAKINFADRKEATYVWSVDPLDGTKEFVKKNGEFSVNVALIENGKPILGVVGIPAQETIAWGLKDYGAFLEKSGLTCRLESKSMTDDQDQYKVVCSRSHLDKDTKRFAESYGEIFWIPQGSSMKFVMVAAGDADFYPRLGPTMEWDTAAPHIIVEEAGGSVLSIETGEPLTYNKENLYNPDFVVLAKGGQLLPFN